jgi:hypothetical protein
MRNHFDTCDFEYVDDGAGTAGQIGVTVEHTTGLLFTNCWFEGIGTSETPGNTSLGVRVESPSHGVTFDNCLFGYMSVGLQLWSGNHFVVRNCYFADGSTRGAKEMVYGITVGNADLYTSCREVYLESNYGAATLEPTGALVHDPARIAFVVGATNIAVTMAATSLTAGSLKYFGMTPMLGSDSTGYRQIPIPRTGVVSYVDVILQGTTTSETEGQSSEVTLSVQKNGGGGLTEVMVLSTASAVKHLYGSVEVAVAKGDYITLVVECSTPWDTPPGTSYIGGTITIEPKDD